MDEAYAVYFKTTGSTDVRYSASGATIPTSMATDFHFENAAEVASKLPGAHDIRTSGPNVISKLMSVHPIIGEGHTISEISFSFRYLAGFDSNAGSWPTVLEPLNAHFFQWVCVGLWHHHRA